MLGFSGYKWTIFSVLYVGYCLYILCRKSFSFAMPSIMSKEGLAKDDLGLVTSSQLLAYTISKFLGGLASDYMSPKTLFTAGLLFSGALTIIFTWFSNVRIYAALWFGVGFLQGGGWPGCANIMRHWFSPTEFGTWWSVLSTSMNVACSAGPIMATFIIAALGWRYLFNLFGTMALGWVAISLLLVVNKPEDLGYEGEDTVANAMKKKEKDIEPYPKPKPKGTKEKSRCCCPKCLQKAQTESKSSPEKSTDQDKHDPHTPKKAAAGEGTWIDLFYSPLFWSLCFCHLIVMALRIAALDWGQMYLIQDLGMSQVKGSAFISAIETGGIVGSILAGYAADKMIANNIKSKNSLQEDNRGSPRWSLTLYMSLLMALCLYLMIFTFSGIVSDLYIMVVGAGLGATLYGCISLYGIMSMEAAPSHLAGTSHAIVSLFANFGGIFAGLPFSYIAKMYNWRTAFYVLGFTIIPTIIIKLLSRKFEYQFVKMKKKIH